MNNKIIAVTCKIYCFYNLIVGAKEIIIQCKKGTEMALKFKVNGAEQMAKRNIKMSPARKEQGGFSQRRMEGKIISAKSSRGQDADEFQDRHMWAGDGQGVYTCRSLHHRNHRHYYTIIFLPFLNRQLTRYTFPGCTCKGRRTEKNYLFK